MPVGEEDDIFGGFAAVLAPFASTVTLRTVPGPGRIGLCTETAGIARVMQALRD